MELTGTFMTLLDSFRPVFTAPTFDTFRLLMAGWIFSVRHRYITDLIVSSDSVGNGHFSDYHRFFSHAKWNIDGLWQRLARLLVAAFVGPGGIIILAGDDTLCRKRGLTVHGTGMHHDPLISSRALRLVSWGHDWVIVCLIVVNPWWARTKVYGLPICMRLYRNKQGLTKGQSKAKRQSRASSKSTKSVGASKKRQQKQTKRAQRKVRRKAARQRGKAQNQAKSTASTHKTRPELMREMLQLVASWFPEHRLLFVADSLYSGESVLRHLPENVDSIGAVHSGGALYEPAPKEKAGRGAPRKKGKRLPTLERWAASRSAWTSYTFDQFGLHGTFETKTRTGLYYKAGRDRLLRFVLTRDTEGSRPTQIFYCTNLDMDVEEILSTYAHRWAVEVTHRDAKQLLGFEDPANRLPLAVQRTAPMAMFLYSLTVLWYHQEGHKHVQFPDRPWYTAKSEPSFADMLTTLRRLSWTDKLSIAPSKRRVRDKFVDLLIYLGTLAG